MEATRPRPAPPARPVVVAGAGLAGSLAAFWLSRAAAVVVLAPSGEPAASDAAAGLVNPRMGPHARRRDGVDAEMDALAATLDLAGASPLFRRTGVVRPARDTRQAGRFADADRAHWLAAGAAAERWPHVAAPHGALWVPDGGSVSVPTLMRALLDVATRNGAVVHDARLVGWTETVDGVTVQTDGGTHGGGTLDASRLVVAVGDGGRHLPALDTLGLHRVKGQTVTLARPAALAADGPAVAGGVYAVPGTDGVVVGATYEHAFAHLAPDEAVGRRLADAAAATVPLLTGADMLGQAAGVRLTVPEAVAPGRRPVARLLSAHVWAFTGLGSRGLLAAPLLARGIAETLSR